MNEHLTDPQVKYVKQQQQLFSNWLENFYKMESGATPQSWKESIDLLEKQVNCALENHTQGLKAVLAGSAGIMGNTEPFSQWFQRLQQGIELCAETQQRLWNVWFDMLRTAVPGMQNPGGSLMKNWQEMMDPIILMQEQMMGVDSGAQAAAGSKAITRRRKSAVSGNISGTRAKKTTRSDV